MEIDHFLFWLPMIGLAFINATLRELVLKKHFSEMRAHQFSTVTLMVICGIYGLLIFRIMKIHNAGQALMVGFIWMLLTVLFEVMLGKILKKSWAQIFEQYNLNRGRLWPVFLLFLLLLPYGLYFILG